MEISRNSIPDWLKGGEFYRSLEDDEFFDLPFNHLPEIPHVKNLKDFSYILELSEYFFLDEYPISIIYYVLVKTKKVLMFLEDSKNKGVLYIDYIFNTIKNGDFFSKKFDKLKEYDKIINPDSPNERIRELKNTKFIKVNSVKSEYNFGNFDLKINIIDVKGKSYSFSTGYSSKDLAFLDSSVKEIENFLDILASSNSSITIDYNRYKIKNYGKLDFLPRKVILEFVSSLKGHLFHEDLNIEINDFNRYNIIKELENIPKNI